MSSVYNIKDICIAVYYYFGTWAAPPRNLTCLFHFCYMVYYKTRQNFLPLSVKLLSFFFGSIYPAVTLAHRGVKLPWCESKVCNDSLWRARRTFQRARWAASPTPAPCTVTPGWWSPRCPQTGCCRDEEREKRRFRFRSIDAWCLTHKIIKFLLNRLERWRRCRL